MKAAPSKVSADNFKRAFGSFLLTFSDSIATFLAEINTKSVHEEVAASNSRMQTVSSHPHSAELTGHVLLTAESNEPVSLKNGAFLGDHNSNSDDQTEKGVATNNQGIASNDDSDSKSFENLNFDLKPYTSKIIADYESRSELIVGQNSNADHIR